MFLFAFVWISLGVINAVIAAGRKRPFGQWLAISLASSALLAAVANLAAGVPVSTGVLLGQVLVLAVLMFTKVPQGSGNAN